MSWLTGKGVCFTGKGNLDGKLVTRDVLEELLRVKGANHCPTYSWHVDLLVASRTDTTKWNKAIEDGKRCITYDEFWQMLGVTTHAELDALLEDDFDAVRAARLREQESAEERAANARAELKAIEDAKTRVLEEAEAQIEGWGTF